MPKGVGKRHRAMVDRLQPYQHGRMAERTALALLDSFSNRDKHRVWLQPVLTIFGTRLSVVGPGLKSAEIYVPYNGEPRVMKSKGNAQRMRYHLSVPPGIYVNMDASALKVGNWVW